MSVWIHECGGEVIWDLSGGFCTGCHAENLEADGGEVVEDDGDGYLADRWEATVEATRRQFDSRQN